VEKIKLFPKGRDTMGDAAKLLASQINNKTIVLTRIIITYKLRPCELN